MNEVNNETVDVGYEVRDCFEFRLAFAPVVIGAPIARELLHRGELHALRPIENRFALRPLSGVDASAQVGKFGIGKIELKRTNSGRVSSLFRGWCSSHLNHNVLPLISP